MTGPSLAGIHPSLIGRHGFENDVRYGEVQTYDDGTPILRGDRVVTRQASGGLLPPREPVEGTAVFHSVGYPGELILQTDDGRFIRLNHSVERALSVESDQRPN